MFLFGNLINIYLQPMKLQEGNVFSHICLSLCPQGGGSHVSITHEELDLTVHAPPPFLDIRPLTTPGPTPGHGHYTGELPASDIWW